MAAEDMIFLDAANQLREATRQGRTFESAQVKVIGLDDIRKAAGDTWSTISARIRSSSMQFLQGCLNSEDLVIPAGDGFLIIYAQAPGRDFEGESQTLRSALNAFFLGKAETGQLAAEVTHTRVDSRGLVGLIGLDDEKNQPAKPDSKQHEFSFVPVWNVKQEAVTGYWIVPPNRAGGQRHAGYERAWADTQVHSDKDYLFLDLAIAARAIEEAERSLASGLRCMIGYSVHASTLQYRGRRCEYLTALYKAPAELRPYLIGRIAEVEPGTPVTTIADWVHQLKPVNGRVTIELHETDRTLAGLNATGVFTVSFTLTAKQYDREGREGYRRHFARWSLALASQGLKLRLDNLLDRDLVSAAVAGNVDFITSELLMPPVDAPEGVYRLGRAQAETVLSRIARSA